ncbi:HAD family hydrolase [Bacteriovoracaceae bacterium]|nr:HAD family hydrolase [Bacteriovoracaceae bacterium]
MTEKKLKFIFIVSLLFSQLTFSKVIANEETSFNTWIYFDLGNTLIDTSNKDGFKYFSNSYQYVQKLKSQGFQVGLITNIPQTFGDNYEEKLKTLKAYVKKKWIGRLPFDWNQFDNIIIPLSDLERKPAPILFSRALFLSNCPLVYFGEDKPEIIAAKSLGLASKLVSKNNFLEINFPSIADLKKLIKEQFSHPHSIACD